MTALPLRQTLGRFRRRVLWIEGAAGLGWGLVAAVLCLLAGAWLDLVLELSPALRIAVLVLAGLVASALVGRFFIAARRKGTDPLVAQRIDEVAESGGQVRAGFDLARPEALTLQSGGTLTAGLAGMTVHRAVELARAVRGDSAFPARPAGRSFGVLASLLGLTTILVLLMPRLGHTQWLRFTDPFGDHPPYSAVTFDLDPRGAEVVYGEGLEIRATPQGPPVDELELVLLRGGDGPNAADREALPMFPETNGTWRASISNVTRPLQYFVRAGGARSRRYGVEVVTVPRITAVRFRITPPAYTRGSEYEGSLPEGGLAGLPGTQVAMRVQSNRPLSGGTLRVRAGGEERKQALRPAASEGKNEVAGTFQITGSGRIEARVTDVAGQASRETFSASVTLLPDERPFVRLLEPRSVSFATPTVPLPVAVSAEDDYGITRLQLYRSLNNSRYLPLEFSVPTPPPKHAYKATRLSLADYGLKPGDEIKLFARVVDNDPAAGRPAEMSQSQPPSGQAGGSLRSTPATPSAAGVGKGSESSVAVVRIISEEEFDRMRRTREGLNVLMSKYRQARRRMESLAEEIETLQKETADLPADSPLAQKTRKRLRRLVKRMQEEAEALRKLAKDELPYELDKELTEKLNKQADALQRLVKRTRSLAQNSEATGRELEKHLEQLARQLEGQRERLDSEMMAPLELLAAVFPLKQDESRFVQLYRRQRDLAERLASLKGRDGEDDPALKRRMRDLEDEQRQIREDLAGLLEDIENHATRLPDESRFDELRQTALQFVQEVRESGAAQAMQDAETGLAEFSGTRGHAGAKKAADILEQFLSKCRGMGRTAGQCLNFQPGLGQCLSQTVQQLLADAGLKPGGMGGVGRGMGGRGGYSARRSTLQNVGLYGGLPVFDQAAGPAQGSSEQARGGRGGVGRHAGRGERGAAYEPGGELKASGAGASAVPLRYRRKVGRYFQRIADELGE